MQPVNAMLHGQVDFGTRPLNLKYNAIQFILSNAVGSYRRCKPQLAAPCELHVSQLANPLAYWFYCQPYGSRIDGLRNVN